MSVVSCYVPDDIKRRMKEYDVSWPKLVKRALVSCLEELDNGTPPERLRVKAYKAKARVITTTVYDD